ncbi:MAG: 2-oxo acid dehydrogenase subunit E2 [bacterium]|nr:2-oxo acid dehydrogenase subunit E2 [bacterium]
MPFLKRPDGTYLKNLPPFRVMIPYLMRGRNDSLLYYDVDVDLKKTLPFIDKYNKQKKPEDQITLFHIIMCTLVRTIAMKPQMNRYVSGLRYYQRKYLSLNFIVKETLTEGGKEINKKVRFNPYETLDTILPKCKREIKDARNNKTKSGDEQTMDLITKFPRWLLKFIMWIFPKLDYYNMAPRSMVMDDPLMCSGFVASLGSLGLDRLHHHMFEWGTCSVFALIGKIKKIPAVDDKGKLYVKDVVGLCFSLDDRVSEAVYFKNTLAFIEEHIENPELLLERPVYPEKVWNEANLDMSIFEEEEKAYAAEAEAKAAKKPKAAAKKTAKKAAKKNKEAAMAS